MFDFVSIRNINMRSLTCLQMYYFHFRSILISFQLSCTTLKISLETRLYLFSLDSRDCIIFAYLVSPPAKLYYFNILVLGLFAWLSLGSPSIVPHSVFRGPESGLRKSIPSKNKDQVRRSFFLPLEQRIINPLARSLTMST